MSTFQLVHLTCDFLRCEEEYDGASYSASRTRAEAKTKGWARRRVRERIYLDYCPTHVAYFKEQPQELAKQAVSAEQAAELIWGGSEGEGEAG